MSLNNIAKILSEHNVTLEDLASKLEWDNKTLTQFINKAADLDNLRAFRIQHLINLLIETSGQKFKIYEIFPNYVPKGSDHLNDFKSLLDIPASERRITKLDPELPDPILEELADLELVIDAGTASDQQIADVLSDLSLLYRAVGGSGINFTLSGVYELSEIEDEL